MAEAALSITISPDDLATLQELPGQIETLARTAREVIDAVRAGADTGNPVGALVSGLGDLGDAVGQMPALEPLIAPIQELSDRLPDSALGDAAAVGDAIDGLLGLFGPLKDAILEGRVEAELGGLVQQALEQTGSLFTPGEEVTALMGELETFFRLLRGMLGWQDQPPNPEDVAELLARALGGMAPDLLDAPAQALEAALAPLEELLPTGVDLNAWQAMPADRLGFWQGLHARLTGGGAIDWPALEAELRAERSVMLRLQEQRDRLMLDVIGRLGRVELGALDSVAEAVGALPKPKDFRLSPFLDGLKRQLAGTADRLEEWAPTEEEIRQLVRSLVDRLLGYLEQSPLGQLRILLIDFQQRILGAVEDLPFRDLAHEAEGILRELAGAMEVIDPDILRGPVQDFFDEIDTRLDSFSGEAVGDAMNTLWSGVEEAITEINTRIETLRTTIEGLVAELETMAESVQPALETVTESVATIQSLLEEFDLTEAADAVVAGLHELRDTVAGLDLSALPETAVSALKAGAEFLRGLNLAGEINPPLNDALAEVDPTPLIQEAAVKISGVTDQLQLLDPAALSRRLDAPVDELLSALSRVSPEQFARLLEEALAPVEEAIRDLDLGQLLAPVTRLFAEIGAKVDAVLDPELLFGPLEELFQPVEALIDGLTPSRFIQQLGPHGEGFAENVGSAAGPPAQVTEAGLREALPAGPEADEELFGFRIGDLLVPLIDLHRQLTQAFDRLDDAVLSGAGARLRERFQGRLETLNPGGVACRIETALGRVHGAFEPGAVSVQLTDAVGGYHDAVGEIARAARQALPPESASAAGRVLALLPAMNPLTLVPERGQFDGVVSASVRIQGDVDLSGLRTALPRLDRIQTLLPEFLKLPELTAEVIRQALRDLDPAPLRVEINALFDRIGQRVVALQEIVFAAMEELGRVAEEFLLPLSPGTLVHLADRLHAGLKQQVMAFHPARFKDEVALIFDTVKRQLAAFDPAVIVQELEEFREGLIQRLRDLVGQLVPDAAPLHEMQERLAQLKPSRILAPLSETLQPVSDLLALLDAETLFEPLIAAVARVRSQVPEVISEVEAALDEVLAAFPEGGTDSAGGSVSLG